MSPVEPGLGQPGGRVKGQLVEDQLAETEIEDVRPAGGPPAEAQFAEAQVAGGQLGGGQVAGGQVAGGQVAGARTAPAGPESELQDREAQRRHLWLVENQARRRAGRRRLLVMLGITSVAVVCLALVALHVLIAENQFRLDNLQQQAAAEQASYEKLRLQVAQLEAPARIVSQAEGRLGMVQPASVTYLPAATSATTKTTAKEVKTGDAGRRGGDATTGARTPSSAVTDPPTTGTVTAPQGDSDWPTVKPYLSGSP
jgi:cell division protein FtsL